MLKAYINLSFYRLIMNKRLFWIILFIAILCICFSAKADTTWTISTGTNLSGCYPVISGSNFLITCTTGMTATSDISTWVINTWSDIGTGIAYTGTEFQQALQWMYDNGLTIYNDETSYRGNDGLTREEAAKIIGQAFVKLGYNQDTKNNSCSFSDIGLANPTLTGYIINTCKRWIFKGTTDKKFFPTQKLTRPEAIAVLVRMFEGKVSNESRIPRWWDYYIKSKALGLTTLNNQTAFGSNITRKEIAIYIRRYKNVLDNETTKFMMLSKLADINTTGQNSNSGLLSELWSLANSLSINSDPELLEAIRWMNDNGLTNFSTIQEYRPFEVLNREQAAKILYNFSQVFKFLLTQHSAPDWGCVFKDISSADTSLVDYIGQVCNLGIMNWSNGYFNPKWVINKSEFIAAIMRLFVGGKLDETTSPRRLSYFNKAQELGMIGPADAVTFENPITRYEVALFLYRFKVKYQILQNINNNVVQDQVVSTVPWSIITGTNNLPESNVYVDMNLLENGNFDVGYLELFGQRYKVVKSNTEKYFTSNFVRYGDIYSLDKEEKIGTVSFIISNFSLIEGTVRIGTSAYVISTISNTSAYYKINKIK